MPQTCPVLVPATSFSRKGSLSELLLTFPEPSQPASLLSPFPLSSVPRFFIACASEWSLCVMDVPHHPYTSIRHPCRALSVLEVEPQALHSPCLWPSSLANGRMGGEQGQSIYSSRSRVFRKATGPDG